MNVVKKIDYRSRRNYIYSSLCLNEFLSFLVLFIFSILYFGINAFSNRII